MKKKVLIVVSIIGIILFINIIRKIGIGLIWESIKNISLENFFILIFLRFLFWSIRTINWKIILNQCCSEIPFWQVFKARITGFAVNYLTPSANIGGEAVRVMLINNKSKKSALASVILDKTIELVSTVFFVIVAIAIALYKLPMPDYQKYIYVGFILLSITMMVFVLRKQHQGLLKWIISKLEKVKISFKFIKNNTDKIREVDENISGFYKNNKKKYFTVLFFYGVQFMIWTTEIFFTLNFIGLESITFLQSYLIVSLGAIAFVMPVLPGGIGIYELTYITVFKLLGLDTSLCMALVIIRRTIALTWAGTGLTFMIRTKK
ncbi:MAG: lysylphosphatidylglycerol synthase transmembrane domain-containing protein [Acidobacteriota bacterium]